MKARKKRGEKKKKTHLVFVDGGKKEVSDKPSVQSYASQHVSTSGSRKKCVFR